MPDLISQVQRATAHPVYLVRWDELPADEVLAWWTSTSLGVLRVSRAVTDHPEVARRLTTRLALLAEHARGLPLRVATRDALSIEISRSVVETVGMIRSQGHLTLAGTHTSILPARALGHVERLRESLCANTLTHRPDPAVRLAALLVEAGLRGPCSEREATALRKQRPKVRAAVQRILSGAPLAAANIAWKWATQSHEHPPWIQPVLRRVKINKPRAKTLGEVASGILASDSMNSKGFRFSPEQLARLAASAREKPWLYLDHDRSLPPAGVVLDAEYHCHGSEHSVSIIVGALNAAGHARLQRGGGFSPGLDLAPMNRSK